jgi:hypothetical protein
MTHKITKPLLSFFAVGIVSAGFAVQEYEVVNIGNLPGLSFGRAAAINNQNVVVGWSYSQGVHTGFRWSEGQSMENMNVWGKDDYTLTDINDEGMMVGSFTENGHTKGFRHWSPGPGVHALWYNEPTNWFQDSQTFGINNQGHMVGNMGLQQNNRHAAGWTIQFGGFMIPGYANGESSQASSINEANTTSGYAYVNGVQRATLFYNNQTVQDLHASINGAAHSTAGKINDQGSAVGIFRGQDNNIWSFIFNPELGTETFSNVAGYQDMSFTSIANSGVVVGYGNSNRASLGHQAVRWTQNTGLVDLNSLIDQNSGWDLDEAYDVNENGYIVGSGKFNGATSNFMLKPVPEPASILGLAIGCFAVLNRRRSVKRKS